ncbi:DUF1428 family protein [Propionibacteriaceae bacterium Y1700]|uniref:DUF1428 family protein n=1 Tax=Microlunatus sp. Y1700 TaxID=3418487 RepID=UPI003DA768D7
MTRTDITIVPVPRDHRDAYVEFSRRTAEVYLDHGATQVVDHWQFGEETHQEEFHADGVDHDPDALQDLSAMMGAADTEAVVVSITQWPSDEVREQGVDAATRDPRVLATLDEDPVFDGRRLVTGTFEEVLRLER